MSKKALVVGLSKSGLAAINLLRKENYNITLTVNEKLDQTILDQFKDIRVIDGMHPLSLLEEKWDFIVKNPGIPYRVEFIAAAQKKGIKIISEIELGYIYSNNINLAITGTNGKTTTTTLIYNIMKEAYDNTYLAGNIGFPLCDVVLEHKSNNYIIMELSSFQLMGIETFKPKISTIMNLSPDHLDYMDTVEDYYYSKTSIFKNQNKDDFYILNLDDQLVVDYSKNINANIITLSTNNKQADVFLENDIIKYKSEPILNINDLSIQGIHNVYNTMFAIAYAKIMNVDNNIIQKICSEFRGVEYRLEKVYENGNIYYNDSKATTPDSTITALNAFNKEEIVLILGGKEKNLDFSKLIELINVKNNIVEVISFGQIKNSFNDIKKETKVVDTLDDAIKYIKGKYKDKVIIFSPATSSFDQFQNYEKRGEYYNKLVKGE
ncbi:UDP-N-acetylmuramoyl-L-alanine--D-glutamate ligase [Mycoplasma sp. P36-A1]|uniref:UDP-N-acetylmuramoyl-L-alanine--D-glutamate ligase n=1 Tax=Mycoplasma sp. P36-A1 TaxID=3252900 RepID=UPI003C301BFD